MNKTFDWTRFCKVVHKDWRNMWTQFGSTMFILASLPFAFWLFLLVTTHDAPMPPEARSISIIFAAELAAIMAASRIYRTSNLRGEGIYFAMLPASKLEKFLSMTLFTFIVSPLLVFVGSMLLDIILTAVPVGSWREWIWESHTGFPFLCRVSDVDVLDTPRYLDGWFTAYMWIGYIASTSIFFMTATIFKKHKVLFTILSIYVIEFVLSLVAIPVGISISNSPDMIEWLYDFVHSAAIDSEQSLNWLLSAGLLLQVIITVVAMWISWSRLKKMPY